MLTKIYTSKGDIEKVGLESKELLKEHITAHTMKIIIENNVQVKS
jgi:hypothetical protein